MLRSIEVKSFDNEIMKEKSSWKIFVEKVDFDENIQRIYEYFEFASISFLNHRKYDAEIVRIDINKKEILSTIKIKFLKLIFNNFLANLK
jgi:hypothetical protein